MACCDDPTEPKKLDRRELIRLQAQYGDLVRDLLTEDPERVILKLLNGTNAYLTELAALRAHHRSVRLKAIGMLELTSAGILRQVIAQDGGGDFARAATARLAEIGADESI